MNPYTFGLVISILVYLAVGNYAGRRVKHLEDYFVAGRNAPTLLIVGTMVASLMSTNAFMGETGTAYSGFPAIVLMITAINMVGYVAGGLFFGRFLRRSRSLTLPEFFGNRFHSRRVRTAAGLTIVFGCSVYLLVITQGTATVIHEVTGLSMTTTLLMSWSGYTLFTLYSGSAGVVLTDTLMFLLFSLVAVVGMFFVVGEVGGWSAAIESLARDQIKPDILAWHGAVTTEAQWQSAADSFIYALILGVAWSLVMAVGPWQAGRYMMARSEHTVIRSAVITAAAIGLLYLALLFTGASIHLINPAIDPPQENIIWAALNVMPLVLGVLVISGIMAAGLSSASTFLSLVGFSIANDIKPVRQLDEKKRLANSRMAMLVVGLVVLAGAYLVPEGRLFVLTYFAGTMFASSWGAVGLMSVWSDRITEAGAFWGILAGLAGNIGWNLLILFGPWDMPTILDPILVGTVLSLAVVLLVSARGTVSDAERFARSALHQTPAEEFDQVKMNRTMRWSVVVIVTGVALSAVLVLGYALPWSRAGGGSLTGALVFSLSYGGGLVIAGALAWWGTRKYYAAQAPYVERGAEAEADA